MSDNPAGQPDTNLMPTHLEWPTVPCEECGETPDSPSWFRHRVCRPAGPQEETHGGAPENGRADAEAKLELARKELAIIAGFECEHGYSEDERDNCACLGCQAHHAATAGLIMTGPNAAASRSDAFETAGPAVPPDALYILERIASARADNPPLLGWTGGTPFTHVRWLASAALESLPAVPGGWQPAPVQAKDADSSLGNESAKQSFVGGQPAEPFTPDSEWQPKAPGGGRTTAEDLYTSEVAAGSLDAAGGGQPRCPTHAFVNGTDARCVCGPSHLGMHEFVGGGQPQQGARAESEGPNPASAATVGESGSAGADSGGLTTTPADERKWPPLEPCDCGNAQQNHGWACRCSDPPSKRAAATSAVARAADTVRDALSYLLDNARYGGAVAALDVLVGALDRAEQALEDAEETLHELWDVLSVQKGADKRATGEYITGTRSFSPSLVKRVRAVLAGSPDTPPPDSQVGMAAPGETPGAPDGETA